MSTYLQQMIEQDLAVTWEVVRAGWEGPMGFGRVVSLQEVSDYATSRVLRATEEVLMFVADLCTAVDETRVREDLERLAPEISDYADRKWRVVLLRECLSELPSEPLYALTRLNVFWGDCGWPADSPHIVQCVDNDISIQDYYTDKMLRVLILAHEGWLAREVSVLQAPEEGV